MLHISPSCPVQAGLRAESTSQSASHVHYCISVMLCSMGLLKQIFSPKRDEILIIQSGYAGVLIFTELLGAVGSVRVFW